MCDAVARIYMRLFYRCFPKWDTLRPELTWSHYCRLISVENEAARLWYMNEAADSVWSTRQMDRQTLISRAGQFRVALVQTRRTLAED